MANPLGAPRLAVCGIVVAALIVLHGTRASAAHPLDSLSSEEIAAAVAVLREAGDIDAATRFALIDLDEPPKAEVLAWKPAQPFIRKAFIVARRDRTVYEAAVDLGARKVERWEPVPNVQSGWWSRNWRTPGALRVPTPVSRDTHEFGEPVQPGPTVSQPKRGFLGGRE